MTRAIGDILPVYSIVAEPAAMKVWSRVLHDPNPIHLDAEVVKAKGLGDRVINQGPANLAYVINALNAAFPGGTIDEIEVRYLDNVHGGETVEASGRITGIEVSDGLARHSCEIWLKAIGRDLVLGGKAIVSIPVSS